MTINPKFSILCPCFNHEKYVSSFIKSVLRQTYKNFELIIVDDCSMDNSVKIIQTFKDPRIKLINHDYNKGVNTALNTAFENSTGDYLIFCASDDIMEDFALEKYKETFENKKVEAVYTNLSVIDENNNLRTDYKNSSLPQLPNYSRDKYLRKMFFEGNSLYSPGIAVSRNIMQNLYPLPPANSIYQDYKMNVEILGQTEVIILQDKLVKYRIVYDSKSLSSSGWKTTMRCELEEASLMDSFLKINDIELLKQIFAQEIAKTKILPYSDTLKFFLGHMALQSCQRSRQIWGYNKIMEFYNETLNKDILKTRYDFVFKDLLNLVNYFDCPNEKKLTPLEHIFSIKDSKNKKHKELCILGCKFKIKRK